jgi:hypothetical protein
VRSGLAGLPVRAPCAFTVRLIEVILAMDDDQGVDGDGVAPEGARL